jgi:hypothetical protein
VNPFELLVRFYRCHLMVFVADLLLMISNIGEKIREKRMDKR